MQKDIRETAVYGEARALYTILRQPGTGQISDAQEVHVSPDGRHAVFAGAFMDSLEAAPTSRICEVDLASGDTRVLTFGRNTDRLPKYSPDGRQVAFLSDRHRAGDFQLYLLDRGTGAALPTPLVDGWAEYLHWSPDGRRILLGVAGHGADVAGAHGAVTSKQLAEDIPPWVPEVDTGDEGYRWRRAWVYEVLTSSMRQVSHADSNIWEAVWCGNEALAVVASPRPDEGLWYSASLQITEIEGGETTHVYKPRDQLGWPAASPSGNHLAIVEAVCSDRWIVAGELRVIDTGSGQIRTVDTSGIDITYTEWRSERELLLAGHRGFETVVGLYDAASRRFTEIWKSRELTTGGFYVSVSGFNQSGDCVLVGEGFARAPEIAVIRQGEYQTVKSFDLGYAGQAKLIDASECVSWRAPDGLDIQGWLLRPRRQPPHPLVMHVHGGPVWHWRPAWLGRNSRSMALLMLIQRGYAVFLPNPRGSSGRGSNFARLVLGEMGGPDTHDYLSGLDHLVKEGIADPMRVGVTGGSYGGFMTAWLITQDSRFAAAVALAPATNQVSQHLTSNIPHFVKLFLADDYTNLAGKYYQRSPIIHASRVKTPTLNICGALDRCTPPEEAMQFHHALLESRTKSVLITYPDEGHGIRKFPASIDYVARVTEWFEKHMPATAGT